MNRTLLAVDLSYQSYRASAAHPNLTSDGTFTGGLFGFFQSVSKMIRECNADQIVFCADCKPYKRSEQFPEYKQWRVATRNEELLTKHKQTMTLLRQILPDLGLPIWELPGFESDDLIGHAVRKYRHRYRRIVAASNDSDLFQLLEADNFYVLRETEWASAWNRQRLLDKKGLTPDQYMLATALMGTHNDLPGIKGVGQVTAMNAVLEPGKLRALRDKHADIIDRNLALIKLPHPEFPWGARIPMATGEFDSRALYRALGRYDIQVTMSMVNALEQVLP